MYNRTQWLDRVVDGGSGEVIQEGTNMSAAHFNNLENGVADNNTAVSMMLIAMGQMIAEQTVEEIMVQLTNTESYPFNNSVKTVSMATIRTNTNYSVGAEVVEHDGEVGHIFVTDKLLNGFKVRYDGSAASATVKLIIKGGM